jgi:hypothetical protein
MWLCLVGGKEARSLSFEPGKQGLKMIKSKPNAKAVRLR